MRPLEGKLGRSDTLGAVQMVQPFLAVVALVEAFGPPWQVLDPPVGWQSADERQETLDDLDRGRAEKKERVSLAPDS